MHVVVDESGAHTGEGTAGHTIDMVKQGDVDMFSAKRRLSANPSYLDIDTQNAAEIH